MNFDRSFNGQHDRPDWLGPRLRRITARNPGPFTFTGTNTYIIGTGDIALIDPGPDDDIHFKNLMDAMRGETLRAIFVTHTHKDHSPLAARVKQATGAKIYAEGVYRPAHEWTEQLPSPLDDSNDMDFKPDVMLRDGETVHGRDWRIEAVTTPGHMANHMCFALDGHDALFSGDHIMAWSTSIVAPPDGDMRDYMASLQKIALRDWSVIWPGHGGPITQPRSSIAAHLHHRMLREAQIIDTLTGEEKTIFQLVLQIYTHLPEHMHGAAALSVFAHVQDLCARGIVTAKPRLSLTAHYISNQARLDL